MGIVMVYGENDGWYWDGLGMVLVYQFLHPIYANIGDGLLVWVYHRNAGKRCVEMFTDPQKTGPEIQWIEMEMEMMWLLYPLVI